MIQTFRRNVAPRSFKFRNFLEIQPTERFKVRNYVTSKRRGSYPLTQRHIPGEENNLFVQSFIHSFMRGLRDNAINI
jgi:hypothetical protein